MNRSLRNCDHRIQAIILFSLLSISTGCGLAFRTDNTYKAESVPKIEDVYVGMILHSPTERFSIPIWPIPLCFYGHDGAPHYFRINLYGGRLSAKRFRIHSAILKGENGKELVLDLVTSRIGVELPANLWAPFEQRWPGSFDYDKQGGLDSWDAHGYASVGVSTGSKSKRIDFRTFGESFNIIIDVSIEFEDEERREVRRTLEIKMIKDLDWRCGVWAIT